MADLEHASIARVRKALNSHNVEMEIRKLSESARTALEAAQALDIHVGQIASSIVFRLVTDSSQIPLLVITSGRHRVDTDLLAEQLCANKIDGEIKRADADFVRQFSGFAIGGVSPLGWLNQDRAFQPISFIDDALYEYDEVWAAAGHTHAVFRSTAHELAEFTGATRVVIADD
jgi:prolyl-tRNA editing enzyme YbaK/EbsC (Cys-tRNA(Pro) deacylase)